ncbi:MAG: Lrp/AsnC family transcriptional regulator [Actinomycetota bacterium]|nr:Lrp/AsnC family transcriptional regulator [Actinomycetota bacterium]
MDDTDRALVEALRADGRATYAELGRIVGLSPPTVHERVRRLEAAGIITGYHAAVEPVAFGLGVGALVGVLLSDDHEADDVVAALHDMSQIEDCWFVAGDETLVLKVRVPDVDALEETLGALRRTAGVARTRTTVVLSTRWEDRIRPTRATAAPVRPAARP